MAPPSCLPVASRLNLPVKSLFKALSKRRCDCCLQNGVFQPWCCWIVSRVARLDCQQLSNSPVGPQLPDNVVSYVSCGGFQPVCFRQPLSSETQVGLFLPKLKGNSACCCIFSGTSLYAPVREVWKLDAPLLFRIVCQRKKCDCSHQANKRFMHGFVTLVSCHVICFAAAIKVLLKCLMRSIVYCHGCSSVILNSDGWERFIC